MNKFVKHQVILILLLFNYSIAAQDVVTNEKKLSKKAVEYFYDGDYQSALPYYLQLYELNPQDIIYNFCLGVIYLNVAPNMSKGIDKSKAIPHLKFVYNKNKVIETSYYLARAYHLTYRFDKAIKYYKEYEDALERYDPVLLTPLFEEKDEIAAIKRQIEMCNNGKLIMQDTIDIEFENLGSIINSPYPDYAPCISADNEVLIFTSRRPSSTGNKKYLDYDYYEDIYISYKINGTWTEAISISENINTKKHDASIGLSPDAQTLFMYYKGDIYMSKLDGDTWNLPEKLGDAINTSAWETHISMTSAQNTIYFVSDRKGGYGDRDIYKARKLPNGEWGMVENLGPKINTPYDEEAPFIHPDEKHLYFSSKGHNSMGGFDIFYSSLQNGEWSEPKNMGYPINTPDDDIYFVVSANGKEGYLSTIRKNSLGDKDIYSALMPDTGEVPLTVIRGLIRDENGKPIYAKFTVIDNETNEVAGYYNANSITGKYLLVFPPGKNYNIIIKAKGYTPHSEKVYIPNQKSFYDIYQEIQLSPVSTNQTATGQDSIIGQKVFMRNAFFDIDKAVQITDPVLSKVQVKEIAYSAFLGNLERSDNRDSIIALLDTVAGVGGFIDDYSPTEQIHIIKEPKNKNMEMIVFGRDTIYATSSSSNTIVELASLDMSVINVQQTYYVTQEELDTAKIHPTLYLSMKGLKEGLEEIVKAAEHDQPLQQDAIGDRDKELAVAPIIQVKGDEGATEELAISNTREPPVKVVKVPEEQATKGELVKVLEELAKEREKHAQTQEDLARFQEQLVIVREGLTQETDNLKKELKNPTNVSEEPTKNLEKSDRFGKDIKIKTKEEIIGKPFLLDNIFFDIEKSTLLPTSVAELKKVLKMMSENVSLIAEISGHTCSLGEENYNLMLSKARAQAVVDFLIDHGISKTRLHAQGYGESRPIETNETLEGRGKNRRIEIDIR